MLLNKRSYISEFLSAKSSIVRNNAKVSFRVLRRETHRAGVRSPFSDEIIKVATAGEKK